MLTGEEYDFAQQKATIWHEAFHAYQLTNFGILGEKVTTEDMRAELEESKESDAPSQEEWLVREVDQKKGLKSKLEGEMERRIMWKPPSTGWRVGTRRIRSVT